MVIGTVLPMTVFNATQSEALWDWMVHNTSESDLEQISKFKLDERLPDIVYGEVPYPDLVFKFIDYFDMKGRGKILILLRSLVGLRPDDSFIVKFCTDTGFPEALKPFDSKQLVEDATTSLETVAKLKDKQVVRETVGYFRAGFETTSGQIELLKNYKSLHDGLHQVQIKLIAIADAAMRAKQEASARRTLGACAAELKSSADRARISASAVPTVAREKDWIAELDGCVVGLETASRSTTDDVNLVAIIDRLRSLLPEASRINSSLVIAAGNLNLDNLINALGKIAEQLNARSSAAKAKLEDGITALSSLKSRLGGLVAQHDRWQWLDQELTAAEFKSGAPEIRVIGWPRFKQRLGDLCDLAPEEIWSLNLRDDMNAWEVLALVGGAAATNGADLDGKFDTFRRDAMQRFYAVDSELGELCGQLAIIATPLDVLLTVIDT